MGLRCFVVSAKVCAHEQTPAETFLLDQQTFELGMWLLLLDEAAAN